MSKRKNILDSVKLDLDNKVETPVEETPVEETPVEETPVAKVVSEVFPEVSANGKFQFISVKHGYVVYNPTANRVTGIISKQEAEDIVRNQNRAAQIR